MCAPCVIDFVPFFFFVILGAFRFVGRTQVVAMLCKLPFKGITRERILLALAHKGYKKKGEFEHELRVVYELVQGNKLHKERLKVCVCMVACFRVVPCPAPPAAAVATAAFIHRLLVMILST